ncbi:MAG: hypothetical protein CM1200mP35_06890 [Chloroflexota bacterium]|nr:MAG: hypothetical protein CM1200mP35_06890 [Chloroflexota bacterium]
MRNITFVQALVEAFQEEMRRDSRVFHLCGGLGPLESLMARIWGNSSQSLSNFGGCIYRGWDWSGWQWL